MSRPPSEELEILLRARYPVIQVCTWEEERAERCLLEIARRRGKRAVLWSSARGLHAPSERLDASARAWPDSTRSALQALAEVAAAREPSLYLFKDLHPSLADPVVVRQLRELSHHLRSTPSSLVLLSPPFDIPHELEKDLTVFDFGLPGREDLAALLEAAEAQLGGQGGKRGQGQATLALDEGGREQVISALLGLTLKEAENALARTLVERGRLSIAEVEALLEEKRQVIRKSRILEYLDTREELDEVGGLAGLKGWVRQRAAAFSEEARRFGLPPPRGMLLVGVQGCGKSLSARAVSRLWRLPLLRLDVGRIFEGLMGSSERNVRRAVAVAESVAPAVLWIDEIDKAFAGRGGGDHDGGTASRVFATLLTWLQEKTAPVFVVATANRLEGLPPELLRKGRFDEIFFLDLPSPEERREIFRIHLGRRGRSPAGFDLEALARVTQGYSGSEIEEAVIAGLYSAFHDGRELSTADLLEAVEQSVPLSQTMPEPLEALRAWCRGRARPASGGVSTAPPLEGAFCPGG